MADRPSVAAEPDDGAFAATATACTPRSFRLGTGASVFASALLPAMRAARHEILLVTCFWAPSESLRGVAAALEALAATRRAERAAADAAATPVPPLRVRIGFSSARGVAQKLFHTASPAGRVHPPASWTHPDLGLPSAAVLRAGGIDLVVKSIFFRPVSVLHPKLLVIDRRRAFVPSCNVSWEPWLEACVEVTGAAVPPLLAFYAATWGDALPGLPGLPSGGVDDADDLPETETTTTIDAPGSLVVRFPATLIPTDVLPSPHHRNPRIGAAQPPPTPLNDALLRLFAAAARRIFVVTPNLTAAPARAALHAALARGVDVDVVTSDRMMVWEQVVTAWTTTAQCVRQLVQAVRAQRQQRRHPGGRLRVFYYRPLGWAPPPAWWSWRSWWPWARSRAAATGDEEQDALLAAEPALCHIKLTIVDGRHTVLGSGNMDRASWFTSQELGLLFHDAAFAQAVQAAVDRVLDSRLELAYEVPGG